MDHDGRPISRPVQHVTWPLRDDAESEYRYFLRQESFGATTRSSRHSGHRITYDSDRVCFMNGRETRTLLGLALKRSFSIWFTNSLDLCPSAFSRF